MDVVAQIHGGGVSLAGRRAAPRHRPRAGRGRPEPAQRAQAARLPDARRARQGAQEGRPQEGPQAPAVLEALAARRRGGWRKLFGTDGVRGVAGEFLTADLALALGRAAAAASPADVAAGPDRPRHARVGRDARGRARRRRRGRGRPRAARRRAAHARRVAAARAASASTSPRSCRPRHNPYRDNGIKFFGPDGTKLSDEHEARIEALVDDEHAGAAEHPGRVRELHGAEGDYLRELESRFAHLDLQRHARAARLRPRRHLPRRARDLPPPQGRRRRDRHRARRAQHQRGLRLDPRRGARRARCARAATTSASPSTVTATACWRSTATARWSTATS